MSFFKNCLKCEEKAKNGYYLFAYLFWSLKNNKCYFSQKCKNKLLILFVYAPVAFWETNKFGELTIKKYLYSILKVVQESFYYIE